jgi:glycerate dehydrogenase
MTRRLSAAFLDFATLGPGVETGALDELIDVAYFPYSEGPDIGERLRDAQVALLNKVNLGGDVITTSPRLELIVLAATGTDNVDLRVAGDRGIAVANIRDYCTPAVVQHVFALILGLTRQLRGYQAIVSEGAWQRSKTFALFDYPIRELTGKRLGIVGFGTLGRGVADAGRCLGMEVLVSARPGTGERDMPADRVAFETLLRQADVISLHCPLTEMNRHLIDATALRHMKRDALLINTARGALVDSLALVEALRNGAIGGAGIDVLAKEPPADEEPLLAPGIPNLILTPHIAWTAKESRQRAIDQVVENVRDYLAGGRLRRII